jgi:hypothetical protein
MPSRRPHLLWLIALPLLATATIGCTTETRSYQVAVVNKTSQPLTIWMVKEHGPMQEGWLSPEEIAKLANPPADDQLPDQVVPPGRTAALGKAKEGEFDKGRGRAVLRVYSGTPSLTQMLAIDRGSMSRLDVPLEPGANNVVIQDTNGIMQAAKPTAAHPAVELSPATEPSANAAAADSPSAVGWSK